VLKTEEAKQLVSLFRQKYPMYSDLSDDGVLQQLSSYALYKPVIEKEFTPPTFREEFMKGLPGATKAAPTVLSNALSAAAPTAIESTTKVAQRIVPGNELAIPSTLIERQGRETFIQGPIGAAKAAAAGRSPIKGLVEPAKQPAFGDSAVNALRSYGVKGETAQTLLGGTVGTLLDYGLNTMIYAGGPGTLAKQGEALANIPQKLYTGVQSKAVSTMRSALTNVFVKAGIDKQTAESAASITIAKKWPELGTMNKTPWRINASAKMIKESSTELAAAMKEEILARTKTASAGQPNAASPQPTAPRSFPLPTPLPLTSAEPINLADYYIHGSPNKFDNFDVSLQGSNEGMAAYGKGMYVSTDLKTAINYGKEYGGTKVKDPYVYLIPKKGLNILTNEQSRTPELWSKIADVLKTKTFNLPDMANKIELAIANKEYLRDPESWDEGFIVDLSWDNYDVYDKVMKAIGVDGIGDLTPQVNKGVDVNQLTGIALFEPDKLNLIRKRSSELISKSEKAPKPLSVEARLQKIKDIHTKMMTSRLPQADLPALSSEALSQERTAEEARFFAMADLRETLRSVIVRKIDDEYWAEVYKGHDQAIEKIDNEIALRANPFLGVDKGFLAIPTADEVVTNLLGETEKVSYSLGKLGRSIGVPSMVAEFGPAGKPVYWAVQKAYDESHELALDAHDILKQEFQFALPETEQRQLSNLLKLAFDVGKSTGNIARYSEATLQSLKASPQVIEAYNRVVDFNKFIADVRIKALKVVNRYEQMSSEDKLKFDKQIEDSVKSGGAGHFATERTNGDHVVLRADQNGDVDFFRLVNGKFAARELAKQVGGRYFMNKQIDLQTATKLSTSDLEALIEQADVNRGSTEIQALLKELNSRSVASYWVKRQFIEGLDFNWKNIIEAQLDYGHRVVSSYARLVGRVNADDAYARMSGLMKPELKAYWKNFIDTFSSGRGKTWAPLARIIYGSELALDVSNGAINFLQPLNTLYGPLGEYWGAETEKKFLEYNVIVNKYITDLMLGNASSLDFKTQGILRALDRQGALGKRVFREMMGERGLKNAQMDSFLGVVQTTTEFRNRALAAIAFSDIGQSKLGLQSFELLLEFVRQKVGYTNFNYDYFNKPPLIQNAGWLKPPANTIYMFRHFLNNQIMQLAHQTKSGNPNQYMRAWGAFMAQAGLKGLPLYAVYSAMQANKDGHTTEDKLRRVMTENKVPKPIQEILLSGTYSIAGVDLSRRVGLGDVYNPKVDIPANIIGVSATFAARLGRAAILYARGDKDKAFELAPPKAIRSVVKAYNYLKRGVTDQNGKRLMLVTMKDAVWVAFGFTPMAISKMYSQRESIQTIQAFHSTNTADLNRRAAKALYVDHNLKAYHEVRKEAREKNVHLNTSSMLAWRNSFKGRAENPAKSIRREVRKTEKAFGT